MSSSTLPRTVAWGLFCSASWTWCIGMFLPFLMLRDWGWSGFLVFAIPNVIGCAAFGYALDRAHASRLRERMGAWPKLFSLATIAFQAAFAGWMLPPAVALASVAFGLALAWRRSQAWLLLAIAVSAMTALCVAKGDAGFASAIALGGARQLSELGFLAPAIALGFAACPYLDLTFHRALDESPSRHAFAVFGVAFAATLCGIALFFDPTTGAPSASPWLIILWAIQLSFTIGAHARELADPLDAAARRSIGLPIALVALAVGSGWLVRAGSGEGSAFGESLYLRFLGLYGLLFPFVLQMRLKCVPRGWAVGAILLGIPCFEAAFVHRHTVWILPPILLLPVLLMQRWDNPRAKEATTP